MEDRRERGLKVGFDRRSQGDVSFLVPTEVEAAGFDACFFERTGGVSEGALASLNLSYSVGDDPDRVRINRMRTIEIAGVAPFALGGQVHGAAITRIGRKRAGSGFDGPTDVLPRTDALFTSSTGVSLAVATADCTPVVLASAPDGLLAVIHAGWRGVSAGIVSRAVALFPEPSRVLAAVGPAAGGCCYEVGDDVAFAVSAAAPSGAVTERRGSRTHLDLPRTIIGILRDAGVERVEEADTCTIHEGARFFSHRREPDGGRQMLVAVRRG
jgi:YfiH family protein